jgi:hypothetical protein
MQVYQIINVTFSKLNFLSLDRNVGKRFEIAHIILCRICEHILILQHILIEFCN